MLVQTCKPKTNLSPLMFNKSNFLCFFVVNEISTSCGSLKQTLSTLTFCQQALPIPSRDPIPIF